MPLDYKIPLGYQYGPSFNEQMQQNVTLADMEDTRRYNQQLRQQQAIEQQRQIGQRNVIQQAAQQKTEPFDLLGMGVDPEAVSKYQELFTKNRDWMTKNQEHVQELTQKNAKALSQIATDLDQNDPNALQTFNERASILGISTEGYPQDINAIKNFASMAFTPQEKINNKQATAKQALGEKQAAAKQKLDEDTLKQTIADEKEKNAIAREKNAFDANKKDKSELDGIDPETQKPYTANQTSMAGYALRAVESNKLTEKLFRDGFDAGKISNAVMKPDKLNLIKDPTQRQYAQAARNFINAILRPESGAVIAESEFKDAYRQYFAQPGDDPATQEQKRQNRLQKIAGLKGQAGSAYQRAEKEYQAISGEQQKPTAHPQDSEAIQWAKSNPNDPRSAAILKANGL